MYKALRTVMEDRYSSVRVIAASSRSEAALRRLCAHAWGRLAHGRQHPCWHTETTHILNDVPPAEDSPQAQPTEEASQQQGQADDRKRGNPCHTGGSLRGSRQTRMQARCQPHGQEGFSSALAKWRCSWRSSAAVHNMVRELPLQPVAAWAANRAGSHAYQIIAFPHFRLGVPIQ